MQRLAELLDLGAARQARRAARSRCRRSPSRRPTAGRSRRRGASPGGAAAGRSWWRPTRRRCRARGGRRRGAAGAAGDAGRAPTRASWRTPRRRSRATRRSWSSRPRTPRRSAALERLYIATGRFADLLAVYDKKLELAKSKAEELEIRFKLAEPLRGRDQAARQGDRALPGDPQAGSRRSCRRWRRSTASTSSSGAGRSWPRRSSAEIDLADGHGRGRRAEVPARRDPRAAPGRRRGRGRSRTARRSRWSPTHVGARTALQAYLSSADPALQQAAVEVLEPIYESTDDLAAPRRGAADQARLTRRRPTSASTCCCGSASSKASWGTPTRPGRRTPAPSRENPASAPAREALENLANILDNWQPLVALYEKALSAKGKEKLPSALERELLAGRRRRLRREAGAVAIARSSTSGARRASSPRTPRRWWRWSGSTPAPSAGAISSTRCSRRRSWSRDAAEREEIRIRIATVWEEMLGNAEQAIVAWNVVLQDNPSQRAGAARARSPVPDARGVPRAGRQPAAAADAGRGRPGETVMLLGRLGALREQQLDQIGAAVDTYAKILELEPEHARDDRRARAHPAATRSTSSTSRSCSSRSTRSRGDWPRLDRASTRSRRATPLDPEQKIALLQADRRRLRGRPRRSGARLRGARPRALAEDPHEPRGADGASSGSPARCGKLDDLVARYGRLVAGGRRSGAQERALSQDRAPLPRSTWATTQQAAAAYVAALDVWPRDLEAANALEQLYLRGARLRQPGPAAAAQGGDRRRRRPRRRRSTSGRRSSTKRCSRTSRSAVEVFQHVLVGRRRRHDGARSARAALHPARALERSQEHLRQEGGAGADAGREEADAVRARSGLRPRARRSGARRRDLQLDHRPRSRGLRRRPGARSAVSADRALVRPARRARAADRAGAVAGARWSRCASASASCGAST